MKNILLFVVALVVLGAIAGCGAPAADAPAGETAGAATAGAAGETK